MREWRDEGVILGHRPQGESAALVEVFTRDHGRHLGILRGGQSRRMAAMLLPGSQVSLEWRARLDAQLGQWRIEPLRARAYVLENRDALAAMTSATALLSQTLPERLAHRALWDVSCAMMDALARPDPLSAYLRWELDLLTHLGWGLSLDACAVSGARQGLAFVSPKTGRAVTWEGAGPFRDRLLPLPAGLRGTGPLAPGDLLAGLRLTGHFLGREIAALGARAQGLPEARARLIDLLARRG